MIEALVRKLSRYASLSREEEDSIRGLPSRVEEYVRGGQIVQEGSSPKESALMSTGLAFRYRALPNGTRQIMALHIPGDFVDLHSFVLRPMDHSVAAASSVWIGRVP